MASGGDATPEAAGAPSAPFSAEQQAWLREEFGASSSHATADTDRPTARTNAGEQAAHGSSAASGENKNMPPHTYTYKKYITPSVGTGPVGPLRAVA